MTPQVNFFQYVAAGTGKEGKTKEEVEKRWCVTKLCVCVKDGVVKDGV